MSYNKVNPDGSLTKVAGDGKGIKTVDIVNGRLIITYDDNTTHDAGAVATVDPRVNFTENYHLDYQYDSATNANYTVLRIYKLKTDGTEQYPFVYAPSGIGGWTESALDVANRCGWLLTINSGLGMSNKVDGQLVENGVVLQNEPAIYHAGSRALIIDSNGDLSEASADADANDLVANGAVSVLCGFMAIIKDYVPVPSSQWPNIAHFVQNAQRQIIGQFNNGDYCIVTCEGRNYDHSDGWTIAEAQTICQKIGLKFAYNLDGGGSTETVIGDKQINTIYENATGRKVPTFLVFNGTNVFERPDPIPKRYGWITATKVKTTYQVGDTLSTSDITTTAHYGDGTTSIVNGTYKTSSVNMSVAGTYNITVSYKENNVTNTTTIPITVIDSPAPVVTLESISATKTKQTYFVDETLSTDDITVMAHYSNETSADVTNNSEYDTSDVDMSVAGTYTITVSYIEGGVNKITYIIITVSNQSQITVTPFNGLSASRITYGDGMRAGYSTNNKRASILTTDIQNKELLNQQKNSYDPKIYPIPIPVNATSISISGAHSNLRPAISIWSADTADEYTPGWSNTNSQTLDLTNKVWAFDAVYYTIAFKDTNNSAISADEWNTHDQWTVTIT